MEYLRSGICMFPISEKRHVFLSKQAGQVFGMQYTHQNFNQNWKSLSLSASVSAALDWKAYAAM
jgi:hypothetical protein